MYLEHRELVYLALELGLWNTVDNIGIILELN
jgi:hypothetical protein